MAVKYAVQGRPDLHVVDGHGHAGPGRRHARVHHRQLDRGDRYHRVRRQQPHQVQGFPSSNGTIEGFWATDDTTLRSMRPTRPTGRTSPCIRAATP